MIALAATGWLSAVLALGALWRVRRELARRMEIVARACHEVRGPLTAIGLGLSAVGGDVLAPSRARALETEVARAALAVQDLADAHVRDSRSGPRCAISMAQLLSDVIAATDARAREAGVPLHGEWLGHDAVVVGERLRLIQALGNVVANAVEHGGGRVSVCGGLRGGTQVRIEVRDEGPGLPASLVRLAARSRAGRGERGRGIAIATSIVRRHGGGLSTAPTTRGARIVLVFPATDAELARPA